MKISIRAQNIFWPPSLPLRARTPTGLLDEVTNTGVHGDDGAGQCVSIHQLCSFALHQHLHLSYVVVPFTQPHGSHCICHQHHTWRETTTIKTILNNVPKEAEPTYPGCTFLCRNSILIWKPNVPQDHDSISFITRRQNTKILKPRLYL